MNNTQNNNTMKFETGKKYYSNKACMAGLPSDITVVKRNAKTLTIQMGRDISRRTIMVNAEGVELIKRSGRAVSLNVFADNR
jgi:hypothetical protein